jgi:uncharacterized membrane protein
MSLTAVFVVNQTSPGMYEIIPTYDGWIVFMTMFWAILIVGLMIVWRR